MKKVILTIISLCLCMSAFAKVNINTATVDELMALKGIGEAKAELIINYREEHGDFANVEDLLKVKGIGEKLLEKLQLDISVSGETDLSDLSQ